MQIFRRMILSDMFVVSRGRNTCQGADLAAFKCSFLNKLHQQSISFIFRLSLSHTHTHKHTNVLYLGMLSQFYFSDPKTFFCSNYCYSNSPFSLLLSLKGERFFFLGCLEFQPFDFNTLLRKRNFQLLYCRVCINFQTSLSVLHFTLGVSADKQKPLYLHLF